MRQVSFTLLVMCCNPAPFRLLPHSSVSPSVAILLSYSEVVTRPAPRHYTTDDHRRNVVAIVILQSTRGTAGSDSWLAEAVEFRDEIQEGLGKGGFLWTQRMFTSRV